MKATIVLICFTLGICCTSCKKDDPFIPNEEELITTLTYTLTPDGGGDAVVLKFVDLDGDGSMSPTVTTDALMANTKYTGAITLLNETESPVEDITVEVAKEDLDHQFFFQSTVDGLSIAYADQDSEGNPIGLATELNTTGMGAGNITITLRHEPMKSEAGVSDGEIANAGGETDIQVTFPVNVQ